MKHRDLFHTKTVNELSRFQDLLGEHFRNSPDSRLFMGRRLFINIAYRISESVIKL